MTKAKYKARHRWMKVLDAKPVTNPPKAIKGTSITIMGCGPSTGVPILGCKCATCTSKDPRNTRTRASVYIQAKDKVFLIDTSPDLRQQAMRHKLFWIDHILYTHPHADHVHGIDELRTYNFLMRREIPCHGNLWTIKSIHTKFDYIFKYSQEGGGKPAINLHLIDKKTKLDGVTVQPLHVIHGKINVLGYRINNVAYITDCSYIPPKTFKQLRNLDVLVMDCLRYEKHPTHVNVEESLAIVKKIGAKRTYLTHMAHEIEYKSLAKQLPRNVFPAYDGLTVVSKR